MSIEVDPPHDINYEELHKLYEEESKILPFEQISREGKEIKSFRYKIFPKLWLKLVGEDTDFKIRWSKLSDPDDQKPKYTLMYPQQPYTYDNIDYIMWLIWWNSTYHYHDDKEKEVHLIELITNFPRMKLHRRLKPIWVSSVWSTVFSNKKSTVDNFKNLSYLFHHCKDMLNNSEDKLRELNKYLNTFIILLKTFFLLFLPKEECQ